MRVFYRGFEAESCVCAGYKDGFAGECYVGIEGRVLETFCQLLLLCLFVGLVVYGKVLWMEVFWLTLTAQR